MSDQLEFLEKLPFSPREALTKRLMKEEYEESLFHMAKYLLGYKEMNWRTHGKIVHTLCDDSLRKLLVLPRGSFKSSIACEAFPIWLLCRDPDLRILLDSEVYTNSKNFLRQIRSHLENERVTNLFGKFGPTTNWNEGELTIAQRKTHRKEASITCSGIGAVKVGQHYDFIIFDDLNSMNNSNTEEGRQKVIDHFKMSISLLEPEGTIIVIGTRYHQGDLIGWIIENQIEGTGLIAR